MNHKFLAFDTSGSILSLTLQSPLGNSYEQYEFGLMHQELLASRIHKLLEVHSLSVSELDAIICSRGPGSFTGLRIGMAFAKGLSQSLNIPLISIPTLDAIAESTCQWIHQGYVLTLIDGKKQRFFWSLYSISDRKKNLCIGPGDLPVTEIVSQVENYFSIEGIEETLYISSPWGTSYVETLRPLFQISLGVQLSIQNLAQFYVSLGSKRYVNKEFDSIQQGIEYLRPSQAEE